MLAPGLRQHAEFETLIGLGTEQIDGLQRRGFATREYEVFGEDYFLYVLNRIAEEPVRLFQAVADLMAPAARAPEIAPAWPQRTA